MKNFVKADNVLQGVLSGFGTYFPIEVYNVDFTKGPATEKSRKTGDTIGYHLCYMLEDKPYIIHLMAGSENHPLKSEIYSQGNYIQVSYDGKMSEKEFAKMIGDFLDDYLE